MGCIIDRCYSHPAIDGYVAVVAFANLPLETMTFNGGMLGKVNSSLGSTRQIDLTLATLTTNRALAE